MTDTWLPVDVVPILDAIARGEDVGPRPTIGFRTDGVFLLYPGELHSAYGEPEAGKGWFALHIAADELTRGGRVLYADFEDTPHNVLGRLVALGAHPLDIKDRFVYLAPEAPLEAQALADLLDDSGPFTLAVLDGMSEAYALLGLDPNSNSDIPTFLQRFPRPIAATGTAVLLIDHVVKNKEARSRFALGGIHKLAGVAVAYGLEVVDQFSRSQAGTVKVTVFKDRHGYIRAHAEGKAIALMHVEPSDHGARIAVRLDPPASVSDDGVFRPTRLMERVSRFLEAQSEPVSKNTVEQSVKGKADYKRQALELLVSEGNVLREHIGTADMHTSLEPFREDTSSPRPDLVPTSSRTNPLGTSSPRPPLTGTRDEDEVAPTQLLTSSSSPATPRNAILDEVA